MKIIDPSYTIIRPCALDAGAGRFAAAVFANALALFDVVYERHPGLPGYAPPQECKSCKIKHLLEVIRNACARVYFKNQYDSDGRACIYRLSAAAAGLAR